MNKKDVSEIEIKVGDKYELATGQDMWKDDLSGIFLQASGKTILSRPVDTDYRTQLEWYNANRLKKNQNDVFYKDFEGQDWFEITKDMDTTRIKLAVKHKILVPKGTAKKTPPKKEGKTIFSTDPVTGLQVYNGPNKNVYRVLQQNKIKDIVTMIEKIEDPAILEIMLEMEQKGWNPTAACRGQVIDTIHKQLKDHAIGLSQITESEHKTLVEELKESKEKGKK